MNRERYPRGRSGQPSLLVLNEDGLWDVSFHLTYLSVGLTGGKFGDFPSDRHGYISIGLGPVGLMIWPWPVGEYPPCR